MRRSVCGVPRSRPGQEPFHGIGSGDPFHNFVRFTLISADNTWGEKIEFQQIAQRLNILGVKG